MRKTSSLVSALAVGVLGLAATAPAAAQGCGFPDNFTGSCWSLTTPFAPQGIGEDFTLEGSGICWKECVLDQKVPVKFALDVLAPDLCGTSATIDVIDTNTGLSVLAGGGYMEYTRTWEELSPSGESYQVYRFLLRMDLETQNQSTSCPVPACAHPGFFPQSYFYGYVDYAIRCSTGQIEHSLVLFHNIDGFIHPPIWSGLPGAFHKELAYAIVGPDTSAQPFLPLNMIHPGGVMDSEAVRTIRTPSGSQLCVMEERIAQSDVSQLFTGCACPLGTTPPSITASSWPGVGGCTSAVGPTAFAALNFWPLLPWYELNSTSIGTWTSPTTYPGREHVWTNEGLFGYIDGCYAQAGSHPTYYDVMYGATTDGGFDIVPGINVFQSQTLIDMGSNYSTPSNAMPIPLPFVGWAMPGRHLIYGTL
jgi:hypothetical protein